jgi:hypothetical protein
MRRINLFVMGVDISFASVTMSAGKAVGVVKPATTQPSTRGSVWEVESGRCEVECACRGLGGHAAERAIA